MFQLNNIQDISIQSYLELYQAAQRSTQQLAELVEESAGAYSSQSSDYSESLFYSDATIKGPYLYQASEAVSVVQSYYQSTKDMEELLDEMSTLVDRVASGSLSSSELEEKQASWKSLVNQYQQVVTQSSSKHSYRLNNDQNAVALYVTSDYTIEVRATDLRFAMSQKDVSSDNDELQTAIGTQQSKIQAYQDYLSSRLTLIQQKSQTSRINFSEAMRSGVHTESLAFAKKLATQVTNDTMQQGVLALQSMKSPSATRVLLHLNADSPSFLWMLN